METWVSQRIRSVSLRRVVVWSIVLVVAGLFATADRRYVANFVGGPYPLSQRDLDSIGDAGVTPHYFARVSTEKVLDTGLRQYTVHRRNGVETDRTESAAYHAYVMGHRFLIVKTPGGAAPNVVEGKLAVWPAGLESQLFDSKEMQSLRANFYPFYIDSDSFRRPGYVMIVVGLLLIALFLWQAIPALRALRNPDAHPLAKRIAAWGDPIGVAVEAEREFQHPHLKGGSWRLGDKYLVQSTFFRFDLLRLHDILWAYKKITKHSVNFIPTGKTYEAVVNGYGRNTSLPGKEPQVEAVLEFLRAKAPWAAHGFSPELQTLWTKQQGEFVAAVEQRRHDWQAKRTV